ncbi:MAG: hypothetical protein IPP69_17880, partial [Flavobacteriales bacterium]|nr:hypothetical protein [Flavobacteriales bacterium]
MRNIWLWLALFISVQGQSQNLTSVEYFFDTDPGLGNGIAIPVSANDSLVISTSIPTTSLTTGFHKLFVRTMDEDGIWSLYEGRSVYIQGSGINTDVQLAEAEYFYDTDPGFGNGTALTATAGDSLIANTMVPTTSLAPGFHKLFVRAKNELGTWSLYEGRTVYIQSPVDPVLPQLTYAEYFYDLDPGFGNGTDFGVTSGDSLSYNAIVPTTGLSGGFHKLFVRTMNSIGTWSLYEWRT